ncbi:ParB/RepB/Spo0J family partition protein [Thiorhodospira sibirica]|uniref:ParB/RepB/Spo0J family partition protein n=1 Tax=Thiorhodospira sibirica TaxID=154347 RepID=UPI00022C5DCE|nr:ParB/RepB/Spo0J family partition protein [Thiorhodospira sibirica]
MAIKPGLGRNLSALLSSASHARQRDDTPADDATMSPGDAQLRQIPIERIQRGQYQPRRKPDEAALQELAESIRAQGMIQPVVLRMVDAGHYELIAGERRWRAAQLAGLHEIPAIVRDIPDQDAAAIALIENIQREDLTPLEQANAFARLIQEFGLTHQAVAEAVGRSRAGVTNFLRLLELAEPVKALLDAGRLEMGHARALLALPPEAQIQLAQRVAEEGLSVRQTERLVQAHNTASAAPSAKQSPPVKDTDIRHLESELSERLGAPVNINHNAKKGGGKLVIQYHSLDELDGILNHLR